MSDESEGERSSAEQLGEQLWIPNISQQEAEAELHASVRGEVEAQDEAAVAGTAAAAAAAEEELGLEAEETEVGGEEEEEEESISSEDKVSIDSDYLKKVLGVPLTFALLDISAKRPTDPIHYLGHYLVKWRWSADNKERYEQQVQDLTVERDAYQKKMKDKAAQEMLQKEQEAEKKSRAEKVESDIEEEEDSELGEVEQQDEIVIND